MPVLKGGGDFHFQTCKKQNFFCNPGGSDLLAWAEKMSKNWLCCLGKIEKLTLSQTLGVRVMRVIGMGLKGLCCQMAMAPGKAKREQRWRRKKAEGWKKAKEGGGETRLKKRPMGWQGRGQVAQRGRRAGV